MRRTMDPRYDEGMLIQAYYVYNLQKLNKKWFIFSCVRSDVAFGHLYINKYYGW